MTEYEQAREWYAASVRAYRRAGELAGHAEDNVSAALAALDKAYEDMIVAKENMIRLTP